MAKRYVFPIVEDAAGCRIGFVVKAPLNPWSGRPAYLANLPNVIGGNVEGGESVAATLAREMVEETWGKLTLQPACTLSASFYNHTFNNTRMDFYYAFGCQQDARSALAQQLHALAQQAAANPRNANKAAITLLENTGNLVWVDLFAINVTTLQTTAASLIAASGLQAGVNNDLLASSSLAAFRFLAGWLQYRYWLQSTKQFTLGIQTAINANIQATKAHLLGASLQVFSQYAARFVAPKQAMDTEVLTIQATPAHAAPQGTGDSYARSIQELYQWQTILDYRMQQGTPTVVGVTATDPLSQRCRALLQALTTLSNIFQARPATPAPGGVPTLRRSATTDNFERLRQRSTPLAPAPVIPTPLARRNSLDPLMRSSAPRPPLLPLAVGPAPLALTTIPVQVTGAPPPVAPVPVGGVPALVHTATQGAGSAHPADRVSQAVHEDGRTTKFRRTDQHGH